MQLLEVSCAVRLIYTSLGAKGLKEEHSLRVLEKVVVLRRCLDQQEREVSV